MPDGSTLLVGEGPWLNFGIANLPGELLFSRGRFEAVTTSGGEFTMTQIPRDAVDICGLIS